MGLSSIDRSLPPGARSRGSWRVDLHWGSKYVKGSVVLFQEPCHAGVSLETCRPDRLIHKAFSSNISMRIGRVGFKEEGAEGSNPVDTEMSEVS